MKNHSLPKSALLVAGLVVLAVAACTKTKTDEMVADTKDAYHDATASMARGWDNLKSYTFEKRGDFTAELKARQTSYDAEVAKLRANYSDAQASASRKAAMDALRDSETDYKEKMAALGNATADTWGSARDNVAASWDRMQASYAKARAGD